MSFERKIERDDRKGLEGLLQYMDRSPVSLQRLTYLADSMVHYQGTKMHPRLGWVANPPVNEPPREALTEPPATMESSLGACPTTAVAEAGRKASSDEESDFAAKRRSQWARLIARTYLVDPERCRSCGEPMKIIAAKHPRSEGDRCLKPHNGLEMHRGRLAIVGGASAPA